MNARPVRVMRYANLQRLIAEAGKPAELARRLGISQGQMSHLTTGRRQIGDEIASRLEAAMGKPPGWMDRDNDPAAVEGDQLTRRVPLIAWDQIRSFGESMAAANDVTQWVIHPDNTLSEKAFALRVRGDSMVNAEGKPSFPDGCIIVVDPSVQAAPGDHVIVELTDRTDPIFKALEFDGADYYLKPLNSRYPITLMPKGSHIIGVVVSVQHHEAIAPRSRT